MSAKHHSTSETNTHFKLKGIISRIKDGNVTQYQNQSEDFVKITPRILIVGPSGVGKSTLVNTVLELEPEEQAEVCDGGKPCTEHFSEYGPSERVPVILIDSNAILMETAKDQRNELLNYIRTKNNNERIEDHVHAAWYVPGEQWGLSDTLYIQMLKDDAKVGVIVVLTKCDLRLQIDKGTNLTALENTKRVISGDVPGVPIVECAKPPAGSLRWVPNTCPRGHSNERFLINTRTSTWICGGDENGKCNEQRTERKGPFGHSELVERTIENVPEVLRTSLLAAQVMDKKKTLFSSLREQSNEHSLASIIPHQHARDAKVTNAPHTPGIREVDAAECDQ